MSTLVRTLQAQHAAMLQMVSELNEHLARAEVTKAGETLGRFRNALRAHLALEDSELYPELEMLAQQSGRQTLAQAAQMFSENMKRITDALSKFVDRYADTKFDVVAFNRDWKSITEVLSQRMRSEERTLFPMYEDALKTAHR